MKATEKRCIYGVVMGEHERVDSRYPVSENQRNQVPRRIHSEIPRTEADVVPFHLLHSSCRRRKACDREVARAGETESPGRSEHTVDEFVGLARRRSGKGVDLPPFEVPPPLSTIEEQLVALGDGQRASGAVDEAVRGELDVVLELHGFFHEVPERRAYLSTV